MSFSVPAKLIHEAMENGLASGGFRLTLGHYRWGRGFADRVFADWRFTDRPLTYWRGLDNRLRMREVRSDQQALL